MDYSTTPDISAQDSDMPSEIPATDGQIQNWSLPNPTPVTNAGTVHGVSTDGYPLVVPHNASITVGQEYETSTGTSTNNPSISRPADLGTGQVITITNTVPNIATSTSAPLGHACNFCPRVFNRAGDLRRHYRKHFASQYVHDCHVPGCNRAGVNGFYRRDKLANHLRQRHGL